jgi:hypothetical protein
VPELIEDACAAWPAASKMKPWFRRALGPDPAFESAQAALDALDVGMRDVLEAWPGKLLPVASLAPTVASLERAATLPAPAAPIPLTVPIAPALRALPAATPAAPERKTATRWLWVANAALVTVALAEGIVLLAQLVRGPAPAPVTAPLRPVKPVVAHTTILPALPPPGPDAAAGVAKPAAPRTPVGWVLIESRVPVKVTANGKLLGTSAHARYHLPPGRHTLTLENQQHGVAFTEPLDLAAGQTVLVTVDPPR